MICLPRIWFSNVFRETLLWNLNSSEATFCAVEDEKEKVDWPRRLSVLVKDLLADRIFAPLSAVRVDKVMANTGIVSILVLASSPPSDALHVTRKTTIHVETVVTRTR